MKNEKILSLNIEPSKLAASPWQSFFCERHQCKLLLLCQQLKQSESLFTYLSQTQMLMSHGKERHRLFSLSSKKRESSECRGDRDGIAAMVGDFLPFL